MRVTCLGVGTIGLSWARLFAEHRHEVVACDPRPDLEQVVAGLEVADEHRGRITCEAGRRAALAGAEIVQESGPESLAFKREVLRDFADHAPADALLFSSTSALLPTDICAEATNETAARVCAGHPFNPPHLMPLVEVVPGARTAAGTLAAAEHFYRSLGRAPVVLARETPGFVGNRLQKALWAEAFRLVQKGVVSAGDLDQVVLNSLGLRWASVGVFEGAQLGGGSGGMRHLIDLLRDSFAAIDLGEPDWSEQAMAPLYAQADALYGLPARPEVVRRRDVRLNAILDHRPREADQAPER